MHTLQKPFNTDAASVTKTVKLGNEVGKRGIPFLLAGLAMLGPFSIDTYLPAFPAIGANLNASAIQVQQTLTAYMVMFAFMILWHGSISDALGRRKVILAGLGCYVFASLFCAFAGRIEMLWVGRAMQGMVELGEEIFHMPVRLGLPRYVGGLSDVVKTPRFATGVGLLLYGLDQQRKHEVHRMHSGSFKDVMARMKEWFQGNF